MQILIFILISVCTVLSIGMIILYKKYRNLYNRNIQECQDFIIYRNKLSMIEYWHRVYKEGGNIYSSMRNISNILKDLDIQR